MYRQGVYGESSRVLLFFQEQVWDPAGVLQVERKTQKNPARGGLGSRSWREHERTPWRTQWCSYDKTPVILRAPVTCPVLVPAEDKKGYVTCSLWGHVYMNRHSTSSSLGRCGSFQSSSSRRRTRQTSPRHTRQLEKAVLWLEASSDESPCQTRCSRPACYPVWDWLRVCSPSCKHRQMTSRQPRIEAPCGIVQKWHGDRFLA